MKKELQDILDIVICRWGKSESHNRLKTIVSEVSSRLLIKNSTARRRLDKLVSLGKLKKDSFPGWANAYFPV